MRYIEELADLLSRVLWQYMAKNVTDFTDGGEEEEVCVIETVDELDFN